MPVSLRITVDPTPLLRFGVSINPRARHPIVRTMFTRIVGVYSAFLRRRYVAASRGGGFWPALAPSTIARRRKGKGQGSPAILRDTGLLFRALNVGAPGNYTKHTDRGIIYGYAAVPHPRRINVRRVGKKGKLGRRIAGLTSGTATFAQIAGYHQRGSGHLPRRRIFVQPDAQTRRQINAMVRRAVAEAARNAGGGRRRP